MSKAGITQAELELVNDIVSFTHNPYEFVIYAFPWGEGELKEHTGPDEWQKDILVLLGDLLKSGVKFDEAFSLVIQIAVASGNGIGKSALICWLILWGLSTFEDTRGVVTAGTDTQLKTKTWAELAKWHRLCICGHWFEYTATAIYSRDPEHERTWRVDAIPWNKTRPDAFAGLHNQGKRILILCDEASAIDDIIHETINGALTDLNTEIIFVAFGNPVRNKGWFRECFRKLRHRWHTRQVDSRTVKITNKEQLQKWIDDYGIDSDFVKVHVRGEFPTASDMQFIPEDIVTAARGRHLRPEQYNFAATIITCDPAWTGADETAIYLRQGLMSKKLMILPKNENDAVVAGHLMRFEDEYKADAVFIDFGFGTGIYSFGKENGRKWTLVRFGDPSSDPKYLNKRAEMWGLMKEWLANGGSIDDDPRLAEELTGPEYFVVATGPNTGKIALESKEDMKARGLPSPNRGDALALSFAYPVRKDRFFNTDKRERCITEYDIFGKR